MAWEDICDSLCPIARALAVVGDRWTLLILRELNLNVRRFDDIQAQTGMPPHLLSTRLKRLEADGIIERRRYCEHPPRHEYFTTPKGQDFDAVLLTLRSWGLKWGGLPPDEPPAVTLIHKPTGATIDANWQPSPNDPPFSFADIRGEPSPNFLAERAARRAAFQEAKRKPSK
jgi:DNA-binding HxlR family transcriptional regulator